MVGFCTVGFGITDFGTACLGLTPVDAGLFAGFAFSAAGFLTTATALVTVGFGAIGLAVLCFTSADNTIAGLLLILNVQ